MNNDLESLFRSSFDDENLIEEDWNVPSDRVWNGIEEDLHKKEKRRFGFFWILPFAVVSGLFALFLFTENKINNQKNQEKELHKNQPNELKSKAENLIPVGNKQDSKTINQLALENKNTDKSIVENTQNKIVSSNNASKKAFSDKNTSKNTASKNIPSFEKKSNDIKNTNADFFTENKNIAVVENIEKINPPVSTNETSVKIDNLTSQRVSMNTPTIEFPQEFKYLVIPELNVDIASIHVSKLDFISLKKIKTTPNYALILSAQTFFVKNKITSKDKVDFSGEKFNLAYTYGISGAKMIGKRSFLTLGIQRSEIRYSLNYDVALPFNTQGEKPNSNGNFDNNYSGEIPTSQGPLKMEMVLQRQAAQTVTQGEAIPLSASGTEKLKFVRIPFSIGGNYFNIGKLQIINQLSFNQMINTSSETIFETVLSRHSAVKETQTIVRLSPKPNQWTPEIGTSLGFYYPLTNKIQLGAEGFFNQSLRPMYKNASYSNTPVSYGIGVNLKYKF